MSCAYAASGMKYSCSVIRLWQYGGVVRWRQQYDAEGLYSDQVRLASLLHPLLRFGRTVRCVFRETEVGERRDDLERRLAQPAGHRGDDAFRGHRVDDR